MRFTALDDWLAWQQRLHPTTIELGLERVRAVLDRLPPCRPRGPVISVAGTNGKGSVVAYLDAMLRADGRRVGTFTSPHLQHYRERICVAGLPADDGALCDAFARIDAARGEVSLTFFEWNTLAALVVFAQAACDALVLEVGLGGRLDAVNAIDADVAVVVSVALDHCEFLGPTVEHIGAEKAGIFRPARPAIFGAADMPESVGRIAGELGADLWRLGRDFAVAPADGGWDYRGRHWSLAGLPPPAIPGVAQLANAATAIAALEAGGTSTQVPESVIRQGLVSVDLPGRFQIVAGRPEWILDVGHNPAAAAELARNLRARPCGGQTWLVCGVLRDKDVEGIGRELAGLGEWIAVGLDGDRAEPVDRLAARLRAGAGAGIRIAATVESGCALARRLAAAEDRIVVFGSFQTVGPALNWLGRVVPAQSR